MDVSGFITRTLLLLSWCYLGHSMPQDARPENAPTVATVSESVPAANITELRNCSTARGVPGACIIRQACDFSTAAIDLTLFAPRGYLKPCTVEEVCCPFDAFAAVTEPAHPSADDSDFDFDDDD